MFARRKQKPRDDDEPLVPHGMVWQATEDEAMPADNLDPREAAPPRTPAIPVPIDAGKTERKPENLSDENLGPTKLGAISPPIAWPSAKIQPIVRSRPEPESTSGKIAELLAEKTSVEKLPVEKIPVEKKTNNQDTGTRPQPPSSTPTSSGSDSEPTPKKKPKSETLGSRMGRTSRRISLATIDMAHGVRELLERISGFVAEHVRVVRPEFRHMASDAKLRVNNWRESIAKSLPQTSRPSVSNRETSTVNQEVSTSNQDVIATVNRPTAFTLLSKVLRREWNRKYHIRIRTSQAPKLSASLASASRQWTLARTSLRRNKRLLMPMAMAGISALLAIALISGLRRYATPVSASHPTATQPQSVPTPTQPQSHPTAPQPQSIPAATQLQVPEVKPSSLLVPAAEASTPPKPSPSQSAEKPKVGKARHGGDYVAKNTYVYYGIAGKPAQTNSKTDSKHK